MDGVKVFKSANSLWLAKNREDIIYNIEKCLKYRVTNISQSEEYPMTLTLDLPIKVGLITFIREKKDGWYLIARIPKTRIVIGYKGIMNGNRVDFKAISGNEFNKANNIKGAYHKFLKSSNSVPIAYSIYTKRAYLKPSEAMLRPFDWIYNQSTLAKVSKYKMNKFLSKENVEYLNKGLKGVSDEY